MSEPGVRVPDERLDEQAAVIADRLNHGLGCLISEFGTSEASEDGFGAEYAPAFEALAALVADLRAARADNQRLRQALCFYADEQNWVRGEEREPSIVGLPMRHRSHIGWDRGERARAALAHPDSSTVESAP